MFNNPLDPNNCFLDVQAGSGGTEAQDWAVDARAHVPALRRAQGLQGRTARGIAPARWPASRAPRSRSPAPYAFGMLRTETGVHRLVRKSPFDSNARRHTSFASVFVYPEVDDTVQVDINPADLRIDVYRASGAGGQHVNKTESAVRITHLPTGIVVQSQNDRSQHRNRAECMAMLKSRLFELEMRKRMVEQNKLEDVQDRHRLGPPDPLLRARPVAHQGSAHQRRDRQHPGGARRRPGRFHHRQPEAGRLSRLHHVRNANYRPILDRRQPDHLAERRAKLAAPARGSGPAYPNDFARTHLAGDLHAAPRRASKRAARADRRSRVAVAGRLMLKRLMGKVELCHLQDGSGRIQFFVTDDDAGAQRARGLPPLGHRRHRGGRAVRCSRPAPASCRCAAANCACWPRRCVRCPTSSTAWPTRRQRYRQRYVDLIVNESTRARPSRSGHAPSPAMRQFLLEHGFLEVETPMLQRHPRRRGGPALCHAPQRARHRHVSCASRRSCTSSAWWSAAWSACSRSTAISATKASARGTTRNSRCSSSTRPTRTCAG